MLPITLRPARPEDCDALTALSLRSKRSNGYDDAFMAACIAELTVTPADLEAGEYWLAEAADREDLYGCACLRADEDGVSGEVEAFFIDPPWKGQGIGRQLWQKLLERAQAKGLMRLYLDADPAAVPFYQAMGFRIIGESPSGSIPGRSLPHMSLSLEAKA